MVVDRIPLFDKLEENRHKQTGFRCNVLDTTAIMCRVKQLDTKEAHRQKKK